MNAPHVGWGTPRTIVELAVSGMLLIAFVVTEQRQRNPLVPFSIFRIEGLAAADATQVIAQAGFLSMFFFITLYMQNVLGFSPIAAGTAYLPVTVGVGIAAGISTGLVARIGTRPIIVAGAVIGAGGVYWLSRSRSWLLSDRPAPRTRYHGARTRGGHGRRPERGERRCTRRQSRPGRRADHDLLNRRRRTRPGDPDSNRDHRSNHLIAAHASTARALTGGFHAALLGCSAFLVGAAVIAARATNTRGQQATGNAPAEVQVPIADAA